MEEHLQKLVQYPLSPQSLASLRYFIINPHILDSSLLSILEALTSSLRLSHNPVPVHHVLKLLTEISTHHPELSPRIYDSVHSNLISADSTRLAVESLAVLASMTERNPSLVPGMESIDDQFLVSLLFGYPVSSRLWLMRNVERLRVRPYLVFTVFLGFTKDPYPCVRKSALDGLVDLSRAGGLDNSDAIEGCYSRALDLLRDQEDCARSAAVRAVGEWGKSLLASDHKKNKTDFAVAIFVQLCSMVRDMSMEVRMEAFNALGTIGAVPEDVLLQTMSKKILQITKEKKLRGVEVSAVRAAGAFVHGLEDEYFEVRKSACNSMLTLTVLSTKFASEALNLLMDVLNDDSMVVRLQALEVLHHMANTGHLRIQEIHMHTFLSILLDSRENIRFSARKILKLVKLSDLVLFRQSIDGLLESLDMYPQDEADVFSVLFHIGQSHGNFAVDIIKKVMEEIELDFGGKLEFDSPRLSALLVLAIAAPISNKQNATCIPPQIYSYSVTMLGRFSHALAEVMDQNTLLEYLTQCSQLSSTSRMEFDRKELFLHVFKQSTPNYKTIEMDNRRNKYHIQCKLSQRTTLHVEPELEENNDIRKSMNLIFLKIKAIWSQVESGYIHGVLSAMRSCKAEVASFTADSPESAGALAFTTLYSQIIELLARVIVHFGLSSRKLQFCETEDLELLLGKLDLKLREARYRYVGLSTAHKLHILELVVLACLLKLCTVHMCCHPKTMKDLSSIMLHIELLYDEGRIVPSDFFHEVKKSLHKTESTTYELFLFHNLIKCFTLEKIKLSEFPRHITADLDVPDNNSENPLFFIPGLPVAIPFTIILCNVLAESKLWLRLTANNELTQFVYLTVNEMEGCEGVQKFTFVASCYITPESVSFTLRTCIGMESSSEDVSLGKRYGGPKHALTYLCREKEVHLSSVSRDSGFN